jgi:hypothetical protein
VRKAENVGAPEKREHVSKRLIRIRPLAFNVELKLSVVEVRLHGQQHFFLPQPEFGNVQVIEVTQPRIEDSAVYMDRFNKLDVPICLLWFHITARYTKTHFSILIWMLRLVSPASVWQMAGCS